MSTVRINYGSTVGKLKIMHAVNNGPYLAPADQKKGNAPAYEAARIPYARTHDAAFDSRYGGEHSVDVHNIFPNFDADPTDPASYDFPCTDKYMQDILSVGTKPFFRLGSKIEHGVKKYGTLPPKDFKKWAVICEHIIRHYTEGWADGFTYDMEYWEIWNEPDLDPDDSPNKRCWGGTEAEFAELYIIAAKHLKSCFPHLKIGGPALAWCEEWLARFLARIGKENTPMDFLSWHWYGTAPREVSEKAARIEKIARAAGYGSVESILNEWNYVRGWSDEWVYSIKTMIGMKGAAFTAACMSECQNTDFLDMLMYYDARMCGMNGLFDYYTMEPLKGYYPFYLFANLYELKNQAEATSDDEDIYVTAATNGEKKAAMITYYADDDNKNPKHLTLTFEGADMDGAKVYVLSETSTMNEYYGATVKDNTVDLFVYRNTVLYLEK